MKSQVSILPAFFIMPKAVSKRQEAAKMKARITALVEQGAEKGENKGNAEQLEKNDDALGIGTASVVYPTKKARAPAEGGKKKKK